VEGCISGIEALQGRMSCSCVGVVIGVGGGVNGGIMELELLKNGGLKGCKAVRLDGGVDRTMRVRQV
jgi:hypothetical protein